ncbi:alpha/beta hydrolase [Cupriavidus sp. 30B13]|uniref:alpha/beta hydrolase n=1 Tax=Cupriavidus sp. 30B13 TaxID=3384241 RepID=UPI003B902251
MHRNITGIARAATDIMLAQHRPGLEITDHDIDGHAARIPLRAYRPAASRPKIPVIVYFHGGRFIGGGMDEADHTAAAIATGTRAWVISVGYSLAPRYPFPTALEDGYLAVRWAVGHAQAHAADARRLGIAGNDAGANLATGVAAMARDRGEIAIAAQALLAPLLDPSMTRIGQGEGQALANLAELARCYRAYLPEVAQQLHPYAAPLESRRLAGLPPTWIATARHDCLQQEAELYAGALRAAGIVTEVLSYAAPSREALETDPAALAGLIAFFGQRLAPPGARPRKSRISL